MKMKAVLVWVLFAAATGVSAQEFDITGSYSGEFQGGMVRLVVMLESPDEYAFHMLEKLDDTFTVMLSPAKDGQFFFEEDGFRVHFTFTPRACEMTAEDETFVLEKKYGTGDSVVGIYTLWMEEGESVLIVVDTEEGYQIITEAWEVEDTLFAPAQSGNSFRATPEGDEEVVFEFTPNSCRLTGGESFSVLFTKEGADDPGFLGLAGGFGVPGAELPDFSVAGNTAETFQRIYGRPLPRSSHASSSSLYVLDSRTIKFRGEEVHSLSPEGSHILTFSPSSFSFYNAEDVTLFHRSAWEGPPIDLSGVAWSPGGTRIAFSEDFFKLMREPDLHVIDIEEGTLRKLTEDGAQEVQFSADQRPTPLLDITPAWTPDGKGILFQRIIHRDEWDSRFFFLPLEDEEARPVSQTLSSMPNILNMRLSLHSTSIFYTNMPPHNYEPEGGIWVLGANDPAPRQILSNTDLDYVFITLHEVAFTDDKALIYLPETLLNPLPPMRTRRASIMLLDLKSGEITDFSPGPSFRLLNATFSPDGSKILYTYRQIQGLPFFLAVRDVGSDFQTVLIESDEELGISRRSTAYGLMGLDWAANDTILVLEQLGMSALLIRLGVR